MTTPYGRNLLQDMASETNKIKFQRLRINLDLRQRNMVWILRSTTTSSYRSADYKKSLGQSNCLFSLTR